MVSDHVSEAAPGVPNEFACVKACMIVYMRVFKSIIALLMPACVGSVLEIAPSS